MQTQHKALAAMLAALGCACPAYADHVVTVSAGRPTSLPTQIPTTIEGITGARIEERINALDAEDALKYLPSLNVRKRYPGDYDHAVLASRASGTGNSARSLVYADGILLSNLLGNGATFTPRWGLVTPEEIERVDVLYGPFSAAYAGNSVGAVVDYQTRMPGKLEAHMKFTGFGQGFAEYGTDARFYGRNGSASLGNRNGKLAWWVDVSRLDSSGQPLVFANRLLSAGVTPAPGAAGGVPVSGAIAGRNPQQRDWYILGSSSQINTTQDHAKVKLAYDLSPTLRASYTLGWWDNDAQRNVESYLRDAAGNPVYRGDINIGGKRFTLTPSDFATASGDLQHLMHGLSLKTHGRGEFDWEAAASKYDYVRDLVVQGGVVTDLGGSGWNTLALKGSWRPGGGHALDFGLQRDTAGLRSRVGATVFNGNTRLTALYAQDTWRISGEWKAMLGLRAERWEAFGGELSGVRFAQRREHSASPKAALSWRAGEQWTLKASTGRAVRNPTAAELFQGNLVDGVIVNTDPTLRAEKSWTTELTAERLGARGSLRGTLFHETTRDALYSQPLTPTANTVQNVGRIRTTGLEISQQQDEVLWHGLSVSSSLTWADSEIASNARLPASVGKRQPRVPEWRATFLASYHVGERWTTSLGARYSGRQYGTLDNSDPNGFSYTGVSDYFVLDARVRYRFDRHWSAALGVDNLNNKKYWAFHPYTQRTVVAELKYDL